jgi:hypothetical protein
MRTPSSPMPTTDPMKTDSSNRHSVQRFVGRERVNRHHGKAAHIVTGFGPYMVAHCLCGVQLSQWRTANRTAPNCLRCERAANAEVSDPA